MIVIIDGPRGSGKSLMCEALRMEFINTPIRVEKFKSTRPDDPFEEMIQAINSFSFNHDRLFIVDRFHLTEYVFSVYHNRVPLSKLINQTIHISRKLERASAIRVVLMASPEVLAERLKNRPEGRGPDMPLELVQPLWAASMAVDDGAKMVFNNHHVDRAAIMNDIIFSTRMVAFLKKHGMEVQNER